MPWLLLGLFFTRLEAWGTRCFPISEEQVRTQCAAALALATRSAPSQCSSRKTFSTTTELQLPRRDNSCQRDPPVLRHRVALTGEYASRAAACRRSRLRILSRFSSCRRRSGQELADQPSSCVIGVLQGFDAMIALARSACWLGTRSEQPDSYDVACGSFLSGCEMATCGAPDFHSSAIADDFQRTRLWPLKVVGDKSTEATEGALWHALSSDRFGLCQTNPEIFYDRMVISSYYASR